MNREQFVATHRERWQRLEDLIRLSGRGRLNRLSVDDLFDFGRLYRGVTSDLAVAQRDLRNDRVTLYLNGLASRAHARLYRQPTWSVLGIGNFIRYGFPAAYRASGIYVAAAFAMFAISGIVSSFLVVIHSGTADLLLPGQAPQLRHVMEQHHLWVQSATENHSVAANFIMLNNIQVAFLAFAGGILIGLGTVAVMITNGISLGTVGAMVAHYDLSRQLWSFVAPHGVIELSVIFTAGGAGLMIGDSILRPGLLRRRDALVKSTARAVTLLAGCVPLLVLAGIIEGFFSPSDVPPGLKIGVGALSGILLYSYLLLSKPKNYETRYSLDQLVQSYSAPRDLISR